MVDEELQFDAESRLPRRRVGNTRIGNDRIQWNLQAADRRGGLGNRIEIG